MSSCWVDLLQTGYSAFMSTSWILFRLTRKVGTLLSYHPTQFSFSERVILIETRLLVCLIEKTLKSIKSCLMMSHNCIRIGTGRHIIIFLHECMCYLIVSPSLWSSSGLLRWTSAASELSPGRRTLETWHCSSATTASGGERGMCCLLELVSGKRNMGVKFAVTFL